MKMDALIFLYIQSLMIINQVFSSIIIKFEKIISAFKMKHEFILAKINYRYSSSS